MKPTCLLRSILWLICLSLGLSGPLRADGFQLPLANGGTWGDSPAGLATSIETALKDSGFLKAVQAADGIAKGLAEGKVPAIEDLTEVVQGDVKKHVEEAVAQATDATGLLALVDLNALKQLFTTLQSTVTKPEQFAFTIPGGRMVVRRDLTTVSLCAVIAGPGGARVTLGMSNDKQLCGNPAERFANPTREPMVFADLAVGLAHVQARRKLLAPPPLPGPDPALSIQAAIYFKIHDDWVQLRLAGNDPQSLTLKLQFAVGVKAGFSAELQAEVEGQIVLELTVKPTQVAVLLHDVGDILKAELGSTPSSADALPARAAGAFKKVFEYLRTVEDGPDELGEVALRFAADGGVGVGIWDTGINAASVGAELTLSVPLAALVSLSGDLMSTQFQSALETSTHLVSLFEAMSEGRLNEAELARQLASIRGTAGGFGQGLVVCFADVIEDIELHLEVGVYALGDIGQIADQTIPLMIVGVDIPVGQIFVDGISGLPRFVDGVSETVQAMAWTAQMAISVGLESTDRLSLGKIVKPPANVGGFIQRPRGLPPTPPTAAQWEAMAADLLDGVEFSVQMGVIKVEGASLGGLVRLAGGSYEVTSSLLEGAVRSAVVGSEKPLVEALRAAPGQIGNEAMDLLIFNLQNLSIGVAGTLGASGTVGLEGAVGVGASIGFSAEFKTSTILLAIGHPGYDEDDGTVLVGIDFPVELSLSAGVAAGEGVELTAEGGFTLGRSLANLTLKDWGTNLPVPAGLRIAGFEVIDFTGTNRQDGTIEGSGWLVLPMGGLVRADRFSLDSAGRVRSGSWSGVLELGPLGEAPLARGSIIEDGLDGRLDLAIERSTLKSDFLLRSDGLLFGNLFGNLEIGGVALADTRLGLTTEGSFSGTTRILGSEFRTTNLRILPGGRLAGSFTGSIPVENQVLNFQSLEIDGDRLRGRTTLSIAGHDAVELMVTFEPGALIGRFVSKLDLFGGGGADAWVRITDRIEVFGDMDPNFLAFFEGQLRGRLLEGISGTQVLLRREQDKLAGYRRDLEEIDARFGPLRAEIQAAKSQALNDAKRIVGEAEAALATATRELLDAIDALANLATDQLKEELSRANRNLGLANTALIAARGEVNKINGQIADWDNRYRRLNDAEKFFAAAGYFGVRAGMLIARDAANVTLAGAQGGFDLARQEVDRIQRLIANDNGAILRKAEKERLAEAAEAALEKAKRDRDAILEILENPELDPAWVVLSLTRAGVVKLISGAEAAIAAAIAALGDAALLVDYVRQSGEASLVKIQRIHFESTVRNLGSGSVLLNVDALVAGQSRRFVLNYDFGGGQNAGQLDTAARLLSPSLYRASSWTVSAWVNDASTSLNPDSILWAYHFNSPVPATVNSVGVGGLTGVAPAVPGRFAIEGFVGAYSGDQNGLTAGTGGSAVLGADFIYGANPGTITFEGLTPGQSYRATFLSVGFDAAPTQRSVAFSNSVNGLIVEQNAYGNNQGIRIDHTFVASETSHRVTLHPMTGPTFHLYAMALSRVTDGNRTLGGWKLDRFGADALNPAIAGDDADPDGDEIPNFLEYALRTNPQGSDPASFGLPTPVQLADGTEARQFVLPYQPTANDVVYRIRQSKDLGAWTDAFRLNLATGGITQLAGVSSTLDPESETVTVTITDLNLLAPPSFWCLTVEKP